MISSTTRSITVNCTVWAKPSHPRMESPTPVEAQQPPSQNGKTVVCREINRKRPVQWAWEACTHLPSLKVRHTAGICGRWSLLVDRPLPEAVLQVSAFPGDIMMFCRGRDLLSCSLTLLAELCTLLCTFWGIYLTYLVNPLADVSIDPAKVKFPICAWMLGGDGGEPYA